ncbi:hypothetical protein SKAU_G00281200 [Synaphobranchus kaupii]|uniref:PiggyBac transposable element-derived protein domain-containing protein n=1 Tax=Synaphobranchus kaupii TaxID=118154 RepID=A0A9Q1IN14_SYNKA|nr:hypothetical protein SKAU_G00281200 [Synaphobranchus kaupii]
MGAVDRVDMFTSFVDCARKSTKWYKKLFFHLLDTAVLNAYTVHRKLSEERMPYKDFRLKLVKELIQELTPALNWRATLCQHPTAAHREVLSFFCASYRSPGKEHRRHCRVCLYTTRRKRERKLKLYVFLM